MKRFKRIVFIGGFVLLIAFLVGYFWLAYYISQEARKDTKAKADVILVLGARSYIDGKYNPCLVARVNHAVTLYRSGYASRVLVSGGDDREDHVNEAETMKKIAVGKGVPSTAILEEKSATSTFENFMLSSRILSQHQLTSVIIVTEPFHLARAALIAKKLSYSFSVSPATDSPCWPKNPYLTKYFLKEPFAIGIYKLQGKL